MWRCQRGAVVVWWALAGCLLAPQRGVAEDAPGALVSRGLEAARAGRSAEAVRLLTQAIEAEPTLAAAHYWRGRERFRLGQIEPSLADFDRFVELEPQLASRQWERGIACYYAGRFRAGERQFALYQTYHDNDVENAVWRYLCQTRVDGIERAQRELLPIENDRRVPMMQIYAMFRGQQTPDDVLAACRAGEPDAATLNDRLFYAHLYVGLYHEAHGRHDEARQHILAAEQRKIGHYMWDVAHVHAERLRAAAPAP